MAQPSPCRWAPSFPPVPRSRRGSSPEVLRGPKGLRCGSGTRFGGARGEEACCPAAPHATTPRCHRSARLGAPHWPAAASRLHPGCIPAASWPHPGCTAPCLVVAGPSASEGCAPPSSHLPPAPFPRSQYFSYMFSPAAHHLPSPPIHLDLSV